MNHPLYGILLRELWGYFDLKQIILYYYFWIILTLFGPSDKILLNSHVSSSLSLWTDIPTPETPFESIVEGLTEEEKGIAKQIVELLFQTGKDR